MLPHATVADGNPVGWMGQFTVSGLFGSISKVEVIFDISGGYNGDLYAYMTGPLGQKSVLLNRPGVNGANPFGSGDAGFSITLDPDTANNIHDYGLSYSLNSRGQVTGTWATDGRDIDPQSNGAAFDLAPISAGLDLFEGQTGTELNGLWTLFVADCAVGGGAPILNGLNLQIITTVPEPQSWLLWLIGSLGLIWRLRSPRRAS